MEQLSSTTAGSQSESLVIVRAWKAGTTWESLVQAVVGNPVHVDIVLHSPNSQSAKFCFSSYMYQRFEMSMMSKENIFHPNATNYALVVTDHEFSRCMDFVMRLVEGKVRFVFIEMLCFAFCCLYI